MLDRVDMAHGSNGDHTDAHERSDDDGDPSPAASARFRIEIDKFGRVVPRVLPVDAADRPPGK